MKEKPNISIIVPVYNVRMYLEKCVNSLINQTLKNLEIILVDDGSTDGSSELCDYYVQEYKNIKVIHKNNAGLGFARNSGLRIATGEYVGFVDADDYVHIRMFEILYENAYNTKADISYCLWKRFYDHDIDQKNIKISYECKKWGEDDIHNYLLDRIGLPPKSLKDNYYGASVCGGIFKKSVIDEHKIRFVSERNFIAEDILFDIDIIPKCKTIVHCDCELYFYRYNPKSLTTLYKPERFEKNIELYHEMTKRLLKNYRENEFFNSMSRYLITVARIAVMQEARFVHKNGWKMAVKNVKNICRNIELQNVLEKYEFKKMPIKYRVICCCEKHKWAFAVLLLCKIKISK